MTTILDDEWIGLREFCNIAGWKIGTAHNKLSRGEDFPVHYKLGKNIRIRMTDAADWLAKQRRVPAAVQIQQQLNT